MRRMSVCASAAVLTVAAPVWAQAGDPAPPVSAPAPKADAATEATSAPAKPADTPQTVTVTAKASGYKRDIDRRSYSVANDLQKAASGSVADILRNVPSVEVDVQGNVSLRGNPSVTILIDGQPSAMMKGQSRSDALQQLPADQIERVEVMTNPSAAFTPEGTGGIINLITKKSAKTTAKTTGSIKASLGTGSRYNGGVSETYSLKGLTLSGSANVRKNGDSNDGYVNGQVVDPVTGAVSRRNSIFSGKSGSLSSSARGAVDYDLDAQTRLSGEVSYFGGRFHSNNTSTYSSDAASGLQSKSYVADFGYVGRFTDLSGSATFLRKLGGDDHEVSLRLSRDADTSRSTSSDRINYTDPTQPNLYQALGAHDTGAETGLKAEYKGPLPGPSKLVAGYEFELDQEVNDHGGALGTSPATTSPVTGLTNNFKASQAVHALYATYQRPFGPLTVMPGLRLEEVIIDLDQVTQATKASQSYFRAYPTVHLAYKLYENRELTASYSQRVQRPGLRSLDPFRVYGSPLSYSQGNSQLRPQITDAFELGYEFRKKATYYLATLYYRDNRREFTSVDQDIGGGVILTTLANLGHSRNAGLELVANGEFTKTLTYNVSSNLYWNEIDPGGLVQASAHSGTTASGRASLNWSPTPKDFFQINTNGRGKTLDGQGYSGPFVSLNLGYRHKFDDKLAFVATAVDPFDQSHFDSTIDTPTLKQQSHYRYHPRALYLGFTYALGAAKARASESFDFGSGGNGK